MRKNLFILYCLIATTFSLFSCSSSDNTETPTSEPTIEYTVIFYGCGGGNLDEQLSGNLAEAEIYGATDKVKWTGIAKLSKKYQTDDAFQQMHGTMHLDLVGHDMTSTSTDINFDMSDPNNIAKTIQEAAAKYPAKKYILVMWDHGGEFSPKDDNLVSGRAVCFDDNLTNSSISIFELQEGIKRSGIKIELVYYDACLMNMIENLYQMREASTYALGAANLTPGLGGNYTRLLQRLHECNGDTKAAMKLYVKDAVDRWRNDSEPSEKLDNENGCDLTFIDNSKLANVANAMKPITDRLIYLHNSDPEKFNAAQETRYPLRYNFDPDDSEEMIKYYASYDMLYMPTLIAKTFNDATLTSLCNTLSSSIDEAILSQETYLKPTAISRTSFGITWINSDFYTTFNYGSIYPYTDFDSIANWSSFLKSNN